MKQILFAAAFAFFFSVTVAQEATADPRFNFRDLLSLMPEQPASPDLKSIVLPNNIKLEYVEQGDPAGTPVIFLHGLGDTWRSYQMVLQQLPASIHAYSVTQRGHGGADKPIKEYDVKDFSEDVFLFMNELNIESAFIVGHSMGGTIAQRFVLDHPEKTLGIVLIGSFVSFTGNESVREFTAYVNMLKDPIDPDFAQQFQSGTVVKPVPVEFMDGVIYDAQLLPARGWKEIIKRFYDADYSSEFNTINKPALLIWGDKDEIATARDQQKLESGIPDAQLKIYRNTGHSVHWEEPASVANDLVQFIEAIRIHSVHRII